jgi:hypothetical protein
MEANFRQALTRSFRELVEGLDVTGILPFMIQDHIFTVDMKESVMANRTSSDMNREFITTLQKRGPSAETSFVRALCATNQSHFIDIINSNMMNRKPMEVPQHSAPAVEYGATPYQLPLQTDKTVCFEQVVAEVSALKPHREAGDRFGTRYVTSTQLFNGAAPKSAFGAQEIPFLYTVKVLGKSIEEVSEWPGAPRKQTFINDMKTYERELEGVFKLIENLENGGLHMMITPTCVSLLQMLKSRHYMSDYHVVYDSGLVEVKVDGVRRSMMSPQQLNALAALIHMMCFADNPMLLIKKADQSRVNCYLLLNAETIVGHYARSTIIPRDNYQIVCQGLGYDEAGKVVKPAGTGMPLWKE